MAQVKSQSSDSSSLAEVVDRILDKGIVVDAWVSVSLVGIELLSIRARVVIASVDTYLKFADRIGETAAVAAPKSQASQEQPAAQSEGQEAESPSVM